MIGTTLMAPKKTLLAWSSGKDAAYALHVLRRRPEIEVVGLLTTLNAAAGRVSMHGVREEVLEAQAGACGLPLVKVSLPDPCTDDDYRRVMAAVIARARTDGVEAMAFGDLFLEEVRDYREKQLAGSGVEPLFPLWGRPTGELAVEMAEAGLQAVVTCVDTEQLDRAFLGRSFDRRLIADLPAGVDPCGENGEFHTLVVGGPMLRERLNVRVGRLEDRGRFIWVDVTLVSGPRARLREPTPRPLSPARTTPESSSSSSPAGPSSGAYG